MPGSDAGARGTKAPAPGADALLLRLSEELERTGGVSDELWSRLEENWTPERLAALLEAAGVDPAVWEARLRPATAGSEVAEPPAREAVRRRVVRPQTVLLVASLGVFMAFVDATIVNIAFPDIQRSFRDASISGLSWVFNAYNIVFAAFLVAAGRIADLLGRRRLFMLGVGLFSFASLLCALAPSVELLVAARALQALGAAVVVPASLALVLEAFPAERRAHAVALWTACAALAAGLGPPLGGLLVELESWRLTFLVNLPIGIATIVLAGRTLIESRAPGRRRMPDLVGALQFAIAIGVLTLGIVMSDDWGWTSPEVLGSFAVAIAVGAIFARRCGWHRQPVFDLALLRIRAFSVANTLVVVGAAGFFAYTLCNVLFLTYVWRYSVLEAGLALTPGPFVATAVAGVAARIADRHDARLVIVPGAFFWAAGVAFLISVVGTRPAFLSEWLPAMVLLGIGAGLAFPTLSGAAVASAPGERFATATALNSVARQVGAALGVALLVAIIGTPSPADAAAAFDRGWTFAAVCFLIAGCGAPLIGRVRPAEPGDEAEAEAPSERASAAAAPRVRRPRPGPALTGPPTAPPPSPQTPADFLRDVPIFADLSEEMRERIAAHASEVELSAGEWLFHRGEPGDSMFVVRSGRLEVVIDDSLVRVLGRGAVLGELALLAESDRSASIRARRDSQLLELKREDFTELLRDAPEFSLALTRVLGRQLQASRGVPSATRPVPATIAVVPLEEGLPVQAFSERLTEELGGWGRISRLDGSECGPLASPEEAVAAYAPLLDRYESDHDQLVLVAELPEGGDPWTAFCLREADRILGLTRGGELPLGLSGQGSLKGCDLVLSGPAPGPDAVAPWVDALEPIASHRLFSGSRFGPSVEAIARRLAGRSLGIVLSGGGARAFAHLGVLEELLGAGVTIDRVGGCSMGAFIGALLAMGMEPEEIDARCYEEWVRRNPLNDYTIPRHALLRGHKLEAAGRRNFGGVAIEELPRDFYAVSCDIRLSQIVVHRHGPLFDAMEATICLPLLGPPRIRGRQLLVDGSLIDNLPVETMAVTGEGPVLAVDVKASFEPPTKAGRGGQEHGARPGGEARPPSLMETMTRVLLLASANTSQAARDHADLVIRPAGGGVGLLEFHQIDRMREEGRRAALEALEAADERLFA